MKLLKKRVFKPLSVIFLSLSLVLVGILGIYDCVIPDSVSHFEGDSLPVFMYAEASKIKLDDRTASAEYKLLNVIPIKKVETVSYENKKLIPGGMPFGVKFFTEGLERSGIVG